MTNKNAKIYMLVNIYWQKSGVLNAKTFFGIFRRALKAGIEAFMK